MLLKDRLHHEGNRLFRRRSFIPLLLLPAVLASLPYFGFMESAFGEIAEEIWMVWCLCVSLAGQGLRCLTVGTVAPGTSGRTQRGQRADSLNTSGMYSIVRHPLYLGNFIVLLGLGLATQVWWLPIIAMLAAALHYERIIMAEEHYLQDQFGDAYAAWAARTPALLPNLRLWRSPERAFSLRTVLKREYNGVALVLLVFPIIELGSDYFGEGEAFGYWLRTDTHWALMFAGGVVLFFTLRTLKKHTRLLREPQAEVSRMAAPRNRS